MSGFSEIRLYQNTTNVVPTGTYTVVTSDFIDSATATIEENVSYQYENGLKTVSGLSPGTTYWFWVELIDSAGNSSGIQPLGDITADDVWLFYDVGSDFTNIQTINQFYYSGAAGSGGTYSLNYDHVTLYDGNQVKGVLPTEGDGSASDTPVVQLGVGAVTTMNLFQEQGPGQIFWEVGSVAAPKLAFSIRIPGNYATKVPEDGWSWTHGAAKPEWLGNWSITRNGVQLQTVPDTLSGDLQQIIYPPPRSCRPSRISDANS